jgi:hypothetical protein
MANATQAGRVIVIGREASASRPARKVPREPPAGRGR